MSARVPANLIRCYLHVSKKEKNKENEVAHIDASSYFFHTISVALVFSSRAVTQ